MSRKVAIAAIAAASIVSFNANALPTAALSLIVVMAQQTDDPFLEQVNAELDRGDEPQPVQPVSQPVTTGPFYYLRVFSALCLVIGLIIAVGYAARRIAGRTPLLAGADLGRVLGRLHLDRNAALYFVETGGQVLLIGVTGQSVTTLAQFDAARFSPEGSEDAPDAPMSAESFLAQLTASSQAMRGPSAPREDDEMLTLRRDIARLQDYLREESRETSE